MATADAREANVRTGLPVLFLGERKHFWCEEVFANNPRILHEPVGRYTVVENYPGRRPYIREILRDRFVYEDSFRVAPGEIYLAPEEMVGVPGAVIVEPHTKQQMGFSRNKAWPWERWQELVRSLDLPWVQLVPPRARVLDGVRAIPTQFREALAHIADASLVVTTDGAFHHAAAALGKSAVVLWGGAAPSRILGYETHTNIGHEPDACGSINDCDHCKRAMERITVEEVKGAIEERLRGLATGS